MSLNRHSKKRDANEREIVAALRLGGCKVLLLDAFDFLVLHNGGLYLMEVKMPDGRLTKSQHQLVRDGWPLGIVQSVDDALNILGICLWEGRP